LRLLLVGQEIPCEQQEDEQPEKKSHCRVHGAP
jgi:hypothetical protein